MLSYLFQDIISQRQLMQKSGISCFFMLWLVSCNWCKMNKLWSMILCSVIYFKILLVRGNWCKKVESAIFSMLWLVSCNWCKTNKLWSMILYPRTSKVFHALIPPYIHNGWRNSKGGRNKVSFRIASACACSRSKRSSNCFQLAIQHPDYNIVVENYCT